MVAKLLTPKRQYIFFSPLNYLLYYKMERKKGDEKVRKFTNSINNHQVRIV